MYFLQVIRKKGWITPSLTLCGARTTKPHTGGRAFLMYSLTSHQEELVWRVGVWVIFSKAGYEETPTPPHQHRPGSTHSGHI